MLYKFLDNIQKEVSPIDIFSLLTHKTFSPINYIGTPSTLGLFLKYIVHVVSKHYEETHTYLTHIRLCIKEHTPSLISINKWCFDLQMLGL